MKNGPYRALNRMFSVLRLTMLRVVCCYRIVSHEAAVVVSGILPLKLLAEKRSNIYGGMDKIISLDSLLNRR